jgi:uracil-DNA glycosylase
MMNVNLPDLLVNDWKSLLKNQFNEEYFIKIGKALELDAKTYTIYPPIDLVFHALNLTSFNATKVIIIGQDPYHGAGQAHGLCFSVPPNIPSPPSLKNIIRELESEYNPLFSKFSEDLTPWANQGVLLLNSVLTVRSNLAGSHSKIGWQLFTEHIIRMLNTEKENLVFMLWGNYAQNVGRAIDRNKHLVLEASHPSPLSANRGGWFGNNHFIKANQYLIQHHKAPIQWI